MATQALTGTAGVQGRLWSARAADFAEIQEPQSAALYDDVIGRLGIGRGTELLDAGCGSGSFAQRAAAAGAHVAGLDASPALIDYARLRVPAAAFTVGELEELPYADAAFGVVTGFNSFQYAADPVHALSEAARVAAGGRIVVAVWGREEDCEAAASVRVMPRRRSIAVTDGVQKGSNAGIWIALMAAYCFAAAARCRRCARRC